MILFAPVSTVIVWERQIEGEGGLLVEGREEQKEEEKMTSIG